MAKEAAERYFIVIGQREIGPYPLLQIIRLRAEGKLESPVRLRQEGSDDIILLRTLVASMRRASRTSDADDTLSGIPLPPSCGSPWAALGLIGLNLLVSLAIGILGAGWLITDPAQLITTGAHFAPYTRDGELWRLLSALFLHGHPAYLLLNMATLYVVGRYLEERIGPGRFLTLYLLAGLGGGVAGMWYAPWSSMAGAAGAIFGILGAALVHARPPGVGLSLAGLRPRLPQALLLIGFIALHGILSQGTNHAAHLGGLGAGLLLAAWLARPGPAALPFRPAAGAAAYIVLGTILYLTTPNHAPEVRSEHTFQSSYQRFQHEERKMQGALRELQPQVDAALRRKNPSPDLGGKVDGMASEWHALAEELARPKLEHNAPLAALQRESAMNARLQAEFLNLLANAARYPETAGAFASNLNNYREARKSSLERLNRLAAQPSNRR